MRNNNSPLFHITQKEYPNTQDKLNLQSPCQICDQGQRHETSRPAAFASETEALTIVFKASDGSCFGLGLRILYRRPQNNSRLHYLMFCTVLPGFSTGITETVLWEDFYTVQYGNPKS